MTSFLMAKTVGNRDATMRVSQGFWGTREHWQNIEGNKGTLANFWEQGNKIRKITVRKHSENVWKHGNIGNFGREQGSKDPPWETLLVGSSSRVMIPRKKNEVRLSEINHR